MSTSWIPLMVKQNFLPGSEYTLKYKVIMVYLMNMSGKVVLQTGVNINFQSLNCHQRLSSVKRIFHVLNPKPERYSSTDKLSTNHMWT